MVTNRKVDHEKNIVMNDYLDAYLYTRDGFSNIKRESQKEHQVKGVDIEFDFNGEHYVCDEKAATDYVNKDFTLNTFCLELSSLQGRDKIEREGWLTNDEEINDSFLFVWVDKATDSELNKCGKEGILSTEICLVRRSKILEHLESIGWTKERLREKCYNIRYNEDRDFCNYKEHGCKFSYSQYNKYEAPINILLTRSVYRMISDFNTIIKKERTA